MKIAIIGYGKMGKEIEKLIDKSKDSISFKIKRSNKSDIKKINDTNTDVAIEFTTPDTAFDNIKILLEKGIPVVCGTTAWLDKLEEAKLLAINNGTALFYAPNYSLGVNLFFAMNKYMAKLMNKHDSYEIKIEEIHHTEKLDAPSGTAVKLADDLLLQIEQKSSWVSDKEASKEEIEIRSRRISGVPGTHIILYQSDIDELSLSHVAHSRAGFAQGALLASKFIVGKKGYYQMDDLLEF